MSAPRINAAAALLARGQDEHVAFIDDAGPCTRAELVGRVSNFAGLLHARGVAPGTRMLLCAEDSVDFAVVCLGAIWAGAVPVMVNPQLGVDDYRYLLEDSGAGLVVASHAALPRFDGLVLPETIAIGDGSAGLDEHSPVDPALAEQGAVCLWQYSSGTTGRPKGTMHSHAALLAAPAGFAAEVLGLSDKDVTFSVSKMFFGYGFGNSLLFSLWHDTTALLMAERPSAAAVLACMAEHQPTVLYSVPTFYAALLAQDDVPAAATARLRLCVSAGEALPAELCRRWLARFGVPIVDGMGSTELLHIFLSNRPDAVAPGTTGHAVAGYTLELRDEQDGPTPSGEIGELFVRGPTMALGYWNKPERDAAVFVDGWVRTGDKFRRDDQGRYIYCGRADDLLKVSGIYVSPFEIEAALALHPAVAEVAVVGAPDVDGLVKPVAFVVTMPDVPRDAALAEALRAHAKASLASYKCPRRVALVEALPKTATGKVERFRLRAAAAKGEGL